MPIIRQCPSCRQIETDEKDHRVLDRGSNHTDKCDMEREAWPRHEVASYDDAIDDYKKSPPV